MNSSRALLVATAGGHLTQLEALAPRLGIDADAALWVTVSTSQSRSLLADREVVWVEYGSPRDCTALVRHWKIARQVVRRERFSVAVSTGASLAPPFLVAARNKGIPAHFIESATRVDGPSFSGRLLRGIPGVHLYSQYESWALGRWRYGGSIFDGWTPRRRAEPAELRRVVVTVGSARGYPFDRMVQAVRRVLPADCSVLWQILDADPTGLPGRVVEELSSGELESELHSADVVISHAGTGSALTALGHQLCPIIVPRQAQHGEHIDDHQTQIAQMLAAKGLAIVRSPDQLQAGDLQLAASWTADQVAGPAFRLAS